METFFIKKGELKTSIICFIIILLCIACKNIEYNEAPLPDTPTMSFCNNHIVGVDHFGRSFGAISSLNKEKQVGVFFWPWIGQPKAKDIYDASKILALPNGLKLLTDINSLDENVSPNGQAHFWGEPIWGYYNSEDEWVIRKQIQMLTIAGVDFIYFDTTNAFIYKNVILKILSVIDEYQQNGWNPPKIVFYTHSHSLQTTREIYQELYKPKLFPNTWYTISGKPLIIAYTNPKDDLEEAKTRGDSTYVTGPLSNEILNFFHFLKPQWPFDPVYSDGFPWVEWTFPPPMHEDRLNVTVASHPACPMSFSLTRNLDNWGRGWNPETKKNVEEDVDKGTFFQRQWDHAIAMQPKLISVGGWNEWIAYKQVYDGEYVLVDAVNKEFSRDIEPMKGGYQDAFYLQLIKNIRKYKGNTDPQAKDKKQTIDLSGAPSQWENVSYTIKNIGESDTERNNQGAALTVFYNAKKAENNLKEVKVTNDEQNIYFRIETKEPFSRGEKKETWLNVLIGTGEPGLKNWESYDYLIGRHFDHTHVSVEKLNSDFSHTEIGLATYNLIGNMLQIQIPRATLNLLKEDKFYFKVASDVENPDDIMSYYTSGSVMPMGRLSFMYEIN